MLLGRVRSKVTYRWGVVVGLLLLPVALWNLHPSRSIPANPDVLRAGSVVAAATVVGGCRREDGHHFGVCPTEVAYVDAGGRGHVARLEIADPQRQSDQQLYVRFDPDRPSVATWASANPGWFLRWGTAVLDTLGALFLAFAPPLFLVLLVREGLRPLRR